MWSCADLAFVIITVVRFSGGLDDANGIKIASAVEVASADGCAQIIVTALRTQLPIIVFEIRPTAENRMRVGDKRHLKARAARSFGGLLNAVKTFLSKTP